MSRFLIIYFMLILFVFTPFVQSQEIDPNPPITTWIKHDGFLEKQTTHAEPIVEIEFFSIDRVQHMLDDINNDIAKCEEDKAIYQAIIDKYNELSK